MATKLIKNLNAFMKWAGKFKEGEYLFRGGAECML